METVLARIEAAGDDHVWIARCCAEEVLGRAALSTPWRAKGRRRCRSTACPSRSRTTSTSPACRPPPPARPSPTRPSGRAAVVAAAARRRRDPDRQDQPRPVRHRPGRRALALRRAAQSVRRRATSPAARARARPWRWRRAGQLRARHRHRRLGPRAGGLQQHRRPEADAGRCQHRGVVPGLPLARLRLDLRADRGDAARVLDVACGLRCRRTRTRAPVAGVEPLPGARFRFGVPQAGDLEFFGDDAAEALFAAAVERLTALGGTAGRHRLRAVPRDRRAALRGPLGGRALRGDRARSCARAAGQRSIPVTRTHHRRARGPLQRRRCLRARCTGWRSCAAPREPCWETIDVLLVPTARRRSTRVDEVAADPSALNASLGTYTNFVNLLDLCRARRARPASAATGLPFGRHADRARASSDRALRGSRRALQRGDRARRWARPAADCPPPQGEPRPSRRHPCSPWSAAHMSGLPLNHELTGAWRPRWPRPRTAPPTACTRCRAPPAQTRPAARG